MGQARRGLTITRIGEARGIIGVKYVDMVDAFPHSPTLAVTGLPGPACAKPSFASAEAGKPGNDNDGRANLSPPPNRPLCCRHLVR
jgi:hypothetical protein